MNHILKQASRPDGSALQISEEINRSLKRTIPIVSSVLFAVGVSVYFLPDWYIENWIWLVAIALPTMELWFFLAFDAVLMLVNINGQKREFYALTDRRLMKLAPKLKSCRLPQTDHVYARPTNDNVGDADIHSRFKFLGDGRTLTTFAAVENPRKAAATIAASKQGWDGLS